MGLQKFRADEAGEKQANGGTPYYTRWMGGPSLALIRECPIENDPTLAPRTVYISDHPDSAFSIPAACRLGGKTVRGYVTCDDNREYVFRRYLPWLTARAYPWLVDQLRHQNAVLALLRADKAPDEVLAVYETKRARLESAIARFAARITKRV
jgi:hypothetical protein